MLGQFPSEAAPQTGEVQGLARPRGNSIGWVKRPRLRRDRNLRALWHASIYFLQHRQSVRQYVSRPSEHIACILIFRWRK
jgi:hypothetical protein